MDQQLVKDYLWLHLVVFLWGFTAVLGVLISLPPVEMVAYRTLLAGLGLAIVIRLKGRGLRVSLQDFVRFLGTGALIAIHWILFFWAAQVSTISVCLAGMATCSLWTALIEPLANKQPVKWYEVALGLLVVVGLLIIFKFEGGYWLGLSLAVISAVVGAVFTVINAKLTRTRSSFIITFYEMCGAFLASVCFLPVYARFISDTGIAWLPTAWDWFWLLVLSQVCTVAAFTLSVALMKRLSAFSINLTINMEPVYGILLAVLVFGEQEKMTPEFYLGTCIILASVGMYPLIHYALKKKRVRQLRRIQ
ncbi:EamA domain-containing membrane protein RarD [Cyclobacterium xiamenense]|jgi:drug/metabolite transporter (DMT)-like permease|uniref:EamA domain-containing membrane protein RarD n=1 Tax=Cyclobacterium xiamenense TaxID=1297121 RepID=A0A1H6WRS6_9BACT|nr:DMT family transporter [Cyclobacterium xiamenense]SEJ19681.1 EamA domain-containing membrane protein RarD [Cyclobacterium xiamenense]